jgi:4-amino-4-deoxy-L-arabinose transferase-like glycosyltransferase
VTGRQGDGARPSPEASPEPDGLPPPRAAPWALANWLLIAAYTLATLLLYNDYGITWDERGHAAYGDAILAWYRSGLTDPRALHQGLYSYLGGLFDVVAQGLARVSPVGAFETRHLLSGLCGVATVIGVQRLTTRLWSARAALWASLVLIATPVFFGHAFNNPKDVPFALGVVWALGAIVAAVPRLPRLSFTQMLPLGLMIGATLAIRIAGVFLLALLGLAGLLGIVDRAGRTPRDQRARRGATELGRLAVSWLAVAAIAYVVMLIVWPAAQVRPLRHPLEALGIAERFPWTYPVLFEGRFVPATELPRYYLAKWAALTLPEVYFLALAGGAFLAGSALVRAGRSALANPRVIGLALVGAAAFGPYAYAAARGAVVYDGLRHALFTIPLLAALCGCAFDALLADRRHRLLCLIVGVGGALSLLVTLRDMVELHPYETVFFNRAIAGGLPDAAGRYETDYWGNSYREGTEWVARHYREAPATTRLRVGSCSPPLSVEYYLPADRFEYVGSYAFRSIDDRPDIFIATTRWACDQRFQGRVVHVVARQGVPLLFVKERIPPPASPGS